MDKEKERPGKGDKLLEHPSITFTSENMDFDIIEMTGNKTFFIQYQNNKKLQSSKKSTTNAKQKRKKILEDENKTLKSEITNFNIMRKLALKQSTANIPQSLKMSKSYNR